MCAQLKAAVLSNKQLILFIGFWAGKSGGQRHQRLHTQSAGQVLITLIIRNISQDTQISGH